MYRIVRKEALRPTVTLYEIEAPLIAKKAQPGQFIILRVDEQGERIPITINNYDPEKGTVTSIFQTVGATTESSATSTRATACRISSVLWARPRRPRARRRSAWWAAASAAPLRTRS